jgi:hypothetical protein
MAGHTPTPWKEREGYICWGDLKTVPIRPMQREWATDPGNKDHDAALANAAFIVRAVNSHAELIAILKYARRFLKKEDVDVHYIDAVLARAEATP